MLNQIKDIALGIGYGLFLTFVASNERREAALARVRAPQQPEYTPESRIQTEEAAEVPDPWMLPADKAPIAAPQQPKAIAPLLLLPAAPEQPESAVTEQPKVEINLNALDSGTLRKLCTQYGIAWRNVRGQGRHLTKGAMVFQLERVATAA
ncbi:hypothetical protein H6F74_26710 [Trichocoleus sp. FACHB-90]|uniref:hypothetical protein n=1 Tax=Cyanophyceae TaxID=3028117 RepID=UPI00168665E2|nr:hypothetical protein [Trichocoleus sp. FACHB-90]MBD1929798.1 hypothetical protein [Trichocoleus sp. FACHB-90]